MGVTRIEQDEKRKQNTTSLHTSTTWLVGASSYASVSASDTSAVVAALEVVRGGSLVGASMSCSSITFFIIGSVTLEIRGAISMFKKSTLTLL